MLRILNRRSRQSGRLQPSETRRCTSFLGARDISDDTPRHDRRLQLARSPWQLENHRIALSAGSNPSLRWLSTSALRYDRKSQNGTDCPHRGLVCRMSTGHGSSRKPREVRRRRLRRDRIRQGLLPHGQYRLCTHPHMTGEERFLPSTRPGSKSLLEPLHRQPPLPRSSQRRTSQTRS